MGRLSNLQQRVLSAIILVIPVLALVVVGGIWYAAVIYAFFAIALGEFTHLMARRGHRVSGGLMLLWLALFVSAHLWPDDRLQAAGMALLLLITMAWTVVRFRQGTANAVTGFGLTLAGSFYVGWAGAHLVGLRLLEDGLFWTLTLAAAVWSADTAAYLVGSLVGRTPLIPDISPRKTWEGYLGGVILSALITGGFMLLWRALGAGDAFTFVQGVLIGLSIGIVAPLGDLGMSVIKRYARVKNSSNLIPGHGGLLDRVDAILVGCLLLYYYVTLFVI
ncbi:MAG: phosphatidate cytidylyltransferase [Anaerolineae bacterium]